MIFNILSGGGMAGTLIVTTTPEATVTCVLDSNASMQRSGTASVSGEISFSLPLIGTWNITVSKTGQTSKSKSVTFTAIGQTISTFLVLDYPIYMNGTEYVTISQFAREGNIREYDDYLRLNANGSYTSSGNVWIYTPAIDLSKYNKLYIEYSGHQSTSSSAMRSYASYFDSVNNSGPVSRTDITSLGFPSKGTKNYTLDVNGSHRIGIGVTNSTLTDTCYILIYRLWLQGKNE